MAIQETTTVNAPIDRVIEAYASEDFARFVCEKMGIGFEGLEVSGDTSGAFSAVSKRSVAADRVPDIAQKFVSKGLQMTQSDTVSAPSADGSRTISSDIKVSGMPVSARATQKLTASADKTVIEVSGQVSCSIPLVGKKIAAAAEPYVGKVLSKLGSLVEQWVAQN
ncbi:DUF2505 domain-containing protein [Rothia sp. P6271]|uniref:DUF2505 domain-containing protein n=1 Tax=unclassified Rothia (in: high G+C Gram-positive bacteria) TaxID=2689056 RepID=UPI003AC1D4E1